MTEHPERTEAERLLSQLTHIKVRGDDRAHPEADTLLLEIIARMALALSDQVTGLQDTMVSATQTGLAAMRSLAPILGTVAARLSEPQSGAEPTETDNDTGQPPTVADLVRETYASRGVLRSHVGPSGHPEFVEPGAKLKARPMGLIPGDVVTNLQEYPDGTCPRVYLGHIAHPYLPDTETLLWWMDEGPSISARTGRADVIGILLPSTDVDRQDRLKRWTEALD